LLLLDIPALLGADMSLITLTTDFGHADWFVGTTKGVILSIAPDTTIIDICHGAPPGDIRAAAFALAAAYKYFPQNTIHVAVVDPSVGGGRAALAVQTARYFFVGPDNGVLSMALENEKILAVHRLENAQYFLSPVSATFHGRDVFAPVAAHLARNLESLADMGPKQETYQKCPLPQHNQDGLLLRGSVAYIDRFGNAITDISNDAAGAAYQIVWCSKAAFPLKPCYTAMPVGHGVAVRGSSGFVEIAINRGNAAERFNLKVGDTVTVRHFDAKPMPTPL
jgi:S-adenosylmethionine hydrolase